MMSTYSRNVARMTRPAPRKQAESRAHARQLTVDRLLTVEVAQLLRAGQKVSESTRAQLRFALVKALGY